MKKSCNRKKVLVDGESTKDCKSKAIRATVQNFND